MNPKILFVDDEQNVLDGIRRLLRQRFEVDTALGGEQGLAKLVSDGPYLVVVADMRMPKMDGIEFLVKARQLDRRVVTMMLTGNADRKTAKDAVERGQVFHFLTKPCGEETLIKAINAGVELHALQDQITKIQAFLKKAS